MFQDRTIDKLVGEQIAKKNAEDRADHVSSGKLSASMLGQPVQWQILKMIGVPGKEVDEYVLRKFKRGNDVEDWLVSAMPGVVDTQKAIEYRNCVGFVDAMVDSSGYQKKCGIIPHEIKSVSNAKYRRIISAKKPDSGHLMQACLYALAVDSEHFAVDYVATDDYRIETYVIDRKDHEREVNSVIDEFEFTLKSGKLPDFVAKEKWQSMPNYCSYPEFVNLKSNEAMVKLKELYPESFKRLAELAVDKP